MFRREWGLFRTALFLYNREIHQNGIFPIIQKTDLDARAKFSAKGGNAHGQTKRECYDRCEASGVAALFCQKMGDANAESTDANLQKYGVILPLRTIGLVTLENGIHTKHCLLKRQAAPVSVL